MLAVMCSTVDRGADLDDAGVSGKKGILGIYIHQVFRSKYPDYIL